MLLRSKVNIHKLIAQNFSTVNHRGFTLIEVLLAISIMAIIGSLIYTSYSSIIQVTEENRVISEEYQTARLILNRISNELTGAILAKENPDEETTFKFIGETDRLYLTAAISRWLKEDSKENEICEIEYFLSSESEEGYTSLLRREDPTVDGSLEGEILELGESVTGIEFIYYSEDGTETDEWNSDNQGSNVRRLPKAVKITLIFDDEKRGMRRYSTVAGIPVDM